MTREEMDSWYCCTVSSVQTLLERVTAKVSTLPYDALGFRDPEGREPDSSGYTQVLCERAPGLSCTTEILMQANDERFLLLTFHRLYGCVDGCLDADVWKGDRQHGLPCVRNSALMSGPPAKIHVGLLGPSKSMQEKAGQWRQQEKKRFKTSLITTDCRHLYIHKDEQNPEDLFFQLGVILSQEDKIPDSDINALHDALVHYLRREFKDCGYDRDVACRVLHAAIRNFAEPEDWRGFRNYIRKAATGHTKNKYKEATSPELRRRFLDPDYQVYYPWAAAHELEVCERTVYRYMQKDGSTTYESHLGISVAQVESLRQRRQLREAIAASAKVRGVKKKSEQKRVQRLRKEMSEEQIYQQFMQEILKNPKAKEILIASEEEEC